MSEPYTPTTDEVRDEYAKGGGEYRDIAEGWFDRWLAQVRADAWTAGEQAGMRRADWEYGASPNVPKPNPYETEEDQ